MKSKIRLKNLLKCQNHLSFSGFRNRYFGNRLFLPNALQQTLAFNQESQTNYHLNDSKILFNSVVEVMTELLRLSTNSASSSSSTFTEARSISHVFWSKPVWSSCSIEMKTRLQRLQNKCIKAIKHKPRLTPSCDLYDDKFLSFLQLCDYESVLFIHKVKSGLVKCDISLITNESVTNRKTRQSELLRLPRFLMTKSQKSLFYRGVSLYNRCYCGGDLRNDMTISSAKFVIKRFVVTELN
jgi:hypothetical protein